MSHSDPAVFVGKSRSKFFRDFIVEDNFFLVFEAGGGVDKTEGHQLMKHIKTAQAEAEAITSVHELEDWVNTAVITPDTPVDFSLSVGVVHKNIMYIKTVNEGEVHLRRGKDFVRVIHGDKAASGYIKEGDLVVFTTSTFRKLIEEEEKLKPTLDKDNPVDIVTKLEEHYDESGDEGSVGIFVELGEVAEETPVKHKPNYHSSAVLNTEVEDDTEAEIDDSEPEDAQDEEDLEPEEPRRTRRVAFQANDDDDEANQEPNTKKKNIFSNFKLPFGNATGNSPKKSKIITMVVLGIILVIFVWSVVFGYQRRQAAEARKKIDAVAASVEKNTTEAEEIAFLNMDRAVELLNKSKADVKELRESVGKGYAREIDGIAAKITEKENSIVQKDVQEPEEFYDLALEDKDAKGDTMFLESDKIAILDKAANTVYNFSADKKSLEKSTNELAGDATIVGMVKGVLFMFVPGKGLYSFTDDTKVKKLIDDDNDWGEIVDIAFFGGNVYMLDPTKGDVYKYAVIASGYGEKASYFIGAQPELGGANSIKIDASVYIGMKDDILKFTRGETDDFKMSLPENNAEISDIYTDEENEKVFALDKKHGTMYILSKTGQYDRQIKAAVLAKANDFVVYKDEILVLSGSKIYKLSDDAGGSTNSDDEAEDE